MRLRIVAPLWAALVLGACANVQFYADENLSNETGFKYHISKPYLLVAKTGAKDKPMNVSVVYLPDLGNPVFAKFKPGFGSSKFSFALNGGQITSFGMTIDAKGSETLNALTAPLTGVAGVIKTLAEAAKVEADAAASLQEQGLDSAVTDKAAKDLRLAQAEIRAILNDEKNISGSQLLTIEKRDTMSKFATDLQPIIENLASPHAMDHAEESAKKLRAFAKILGAISPELAADDGNAKRIISRIASTRGLLTDVAKALDPPASVLAFQLFEIRITSGGTTTLIPVDIP